MGCSACGKVLLFIPNLIFSLAGLALIVIGTLYKIHLDHFKDAIPDNYNTISVAPILTIVIGSIIFVVSFFGCCGTLKDSSCLLTTYAVILLTIFILQVALGVYVFLELKDEQSFKEAVGATLTKLFENAKETGRNDTTNLLQKELKCCGLTGPNFWKNNVPDSCKNSNKEIYQDGCIDKFVDFLKGNINPIGIAVLVISSTEVFCSIFALCIANSIRNNKRRNIYQ